MRKTTMFFGISLKMNFRFVHWFFVTCPWEIDIFRMRIRSFALWCQAFSEIIHSPLVSGDCWFFYLSTIVQSPNPQTFPRLCVIRSKLNKTRVSILSLMSNFCIEHDDKNGKNFSDYLSIVRSLFCVRDVCVCVLRNSVFFVEHMITFHRNLAINIRCHCDCAVE